MTEAPQKASPLEDLAQQADALAAPLGEGTTDLDVAARAGQVEEVPIQTNAEILSGAIQLVRDTVTQLAGVQSIQTTLNNDAAATLGTMWGKVLDGYGIKLSAYMGRHGEAIMATLATLAIGKTVLDGYRQEKAAKAAQKPAEPAPAPA